MQSISRRSVLSGTAAALAGAATVGASPRARAEHGSAKPDHVTLSYDQARVDRYQPYVVIPSEASRPTEWKAWIAESTEYDYEVLVYFLYWQTQDTGNAATSHRRDREPVYVFVDASSETVAETVYTGYHWFAYREQRPPTFVPENGDEEHPTLRVDPKYHHYTQTNEVGENLTVAPLGTDDGDPFADGSQTTFETWLDTGWEEHLHPGAAQDPDIMRYRDSWWADDEERFAKALWSVQLRMAQFDLFPSSALGGAGRTDFV